MNLGAFDRKALPRTKLQLIEAVDAALVAGDALAFGALVRDGSMASSLCPDLSAEDRTAWAAKQAARRDAAGDAFAACLELGDFSKAKRLALNYGTRRFAEDERCSSAWKRHESSEMFYVMGDRVMVVRMRQASTFGGQHALGRIRCGLKKPGSAADADLMMKRLGHRCPQVKWPALAQARGTCPAP